MEHITSAKNPTIRELKSLSTRKGREETGRFLVEGEVMIEEALKCGLAIHDVLADEAHAAFAEGLAARNARVYAVPRSLLEGVCETKTPQGVCASFDVPAPLAPESAPAAASPGRIPFSYRASASRPS